MPTDFPRDELTAEERAYIAGHGIEHVHVRWHEKYRDRLLRAAHKMRAKPWRTRDDDFLAEVDAIMAEICEAGERNLAAARREALDFIACLARDYPESGVLQRCFKYLKDHGAAEELTLHPCGCLGRHLLSCKATPELLRETK